MARQGAPLDDRAAMTTLDLRWAPSGAKLQIRGGILVMIGTLRGWVFSPGRVPS